jgi:hypothetical protein
VDDLEARIARWVGTPPPDVSVTARGAAVTYSLLVDPARWIHRRVESISLIDDTTVNRRVSADYTLPRTLGPIQIRATLLSYLPLTLLRKQPLRNFNLRHEDQAAALLTRRQNEFVVSAALVYTAETILKTPIPEDVGKELVRFAHADTAQATKYLQTWRERQRAPWDLLLADPTFLSTLDALADSWALLAVLPIRPGSRQMAKFSYDEPLDLSSESIGRRRRLAQAVGWVPWEVAFTVPATRSASYHFEMLCPPDLEVMESELRVGAELVDRDGPTVTRVHLSASDAEPGVGQAVTWIRARRGGFLLAAFLVGMLSTAMLIFGLARLPEILEEEGSGAAGLLLLVPSFLASFLVRPGEHRLVSTMLRGVRVLTIAAVVPAIVAAGLLAAYRTSEALPELWGVALGVAAVCTLALSLSNAWPKRKSAVYPSDSGATL